MVRISKQQERRGITKKRPKAPSQKTGPKSDNLPEGFKQHQNACDQGSVKNCFIPKIR